MLKVGDKVTRELGFIEEVSTVKRRLGGCRSCAELELANGRVIAATDPCWRPWRPGDDEEAKRYQDQETAASFCDWYSLGAEDAAAVAAVVRRHQQAGKRDGG